MTATETTDTALRTVTLNVNGQTIRQQVESRTLLAYALRDAGLKGTHVGCDTSSCGCCVVLLDGDTPAKSCTMFAVQAEGREITTVEGLGSPGDLHPLQQAFWDQHGLQCGYCTPGMLMTAKAMLEHNPDPTDQEVREFLSGNLCRCTGYNNIVKAVQQAARVMRDEAQAQALAGMVPGPGASTGPSTGTAERGAQ
ncbi:(2Fe-2S)-binding protein [Deinococcus caeni]|uniref:Carbon monoxide dehydrogenase small chain n=1 Tax=Deinococcus caeni TaxID=569127 RepID=A0ABP9UEB0_9DEIO